MPLSNGYAPLILRVAGLPAETMAPFHHPRLIDALVERERLREELGSLRASLVDCLHQAIHGAPREDRRFLLTLKRRSFNGEDLATYRSDPRWSLLSNIAGSLVDTIVAREAAIAALDTTLDELYLRTIRQEQESIALLIKNRSFMRGVTLASPRLVQSLARLNGREAHDYGRREKRLCLALLRYASRAALKLSPFTTLTRTALAWATENATGFSFVPDGDWRERSSIGLRRELLGQYTCLLLRCRRFVTSLPVAVNETVAADGQERYQFFLPSRWVFEDDSRSFRYQDASFVRVKLEGCLVPWLLAELRDQPRILGEILAKAKTELETDDGDAMTQSLTALIKVGFLTPVLPWDSSTPDLERQILGYLSTLGDGPDLTAFRGGLLELAGILEGYPEASSPCDFLKESKHRVEDLFRALVAPADLPPRIEFNAPIDTFEEDVFLLPGSGSAVTSEIARLSWSRMRALLEDLSPLARLANLCSSHHDLMHTLSTLGARLWPGARDVDFLEFFSGTQSIFGEYIRHWRSEQRAFNPLDLASVTELVRWRQHTGSQIPACFGQSGHEQGQRLCPQALTDLLDRTSSPYAEPWDFCAFVQPLDEEGRTWVVNRIGEGYGRFGGRFTAGMYPGMRERWASYFTALSILDFDEGEAELIDMSCPGGGTVNVHVPQTCRVLKMPGERSSLPAERVLRLCDLRVRLRGVDRPPLLVDRAGRRLLPVQLGSSASRRRPTVLKFLATFGPSDLPPRLPLRASLREDGIEKIDRHLIGSAVYSRKKWHAELQPLLSLIDMRSENKSFAAINAWRLANGIPDRVFVRKRSAASRHKPQYIDFTSPSFVQAFRSMLKMDVENLSLEEALPAPEHLPLCAGHWATEVQLESFCFRHRSRRPLRETRRELQTACPAGAT